MSRVYSVSERYVSSYKTIFEWGFDDATYRPSSVSQEFVFYFFFRSHLNFLALERGGDDMEVEGITVIGSRTKFIIFSYF